jgi:hypothetical protein
MNPDRQQAIDYLRGPVNGLWRWAENGAVLVWRDGTTIAFREEIVQIIEWLAPNGLPSFGAVVFLLAACRGKVPSVADIVAISNAPLPTGMGKDAALLLSARRQLQAQIGVALTELAKVSQLPSEINSGMKAKCVLAEAVFEPAKVERYVEARAVLRGMREPMDVADLIDGEHGAASGSYVRQIHLVAEGLKLHTVDSLTLRLRTGLDALPTAPDLDLPAAERARRLIDELSRDREHGAVARAARELMAAVRLPRRLAQREELAIGGVADITNRGPLDRLLLSELAHDDLTLSVRVALNEALYLRREPPMREPPGTLALLLDSGVRLWGVPRVLATAVALALIARDKQHSEVLVWRGHGKQLQSVDLLSRNGLTQHLGILESNAHPGECVPAFVDALANDARNQSVLITHRDALADAEFRRSLADNPAAPGFVATVDRDGRFELHALPLSHRPAVCEADLDLTTVFTENAAVPPIKVEVDPDLPAIFGITPFPFLLPVAGSVDFWIKGEDGCVYAVTNDQRLLQFKDAKTGARVLANMPPGKTLWMDWVDGIVHIVKAGASQRPTRLLSLSLPYGQLRVTDLVSGPEVSAVHRYGEAIVLIRGHDIRAHALGDGRQLGHAMNPHPWANGRYFRGEKHFYFAVWDGERAKFEPVTTPYSPSVIAQIFDRQGLDAGPWVVHRGGRVFSLSTDSKVDLPMPQGRKYGINEVRVSRDGNRVFFSLEQSDWRRIKDLESGEVIELSKSGWLDMNSPPPLPQWNMYRVIEAIGWTLGTLALRGRKGRWRVFSHGQDGKFKIVDAPTPTLVIKNRESFKEPRQINFGCTLSTAIYSNGSKIFLDSRGLLHFKSSDRNLPEVSLVLADGEVAGWTSDGHACGPQFFFDRPIISDPKPVFERVTKFFDKL